MVYSGLSGTLAQTSPKREASRKPTQKINVYLKQSKTAAHQGKTEQAQAYLDRATSLSQSLNSQSYLLRCQVQQALLYDRQGDYHKAKSYIEQARKNLILHDRKGVFEFQKAIGIILEHLDEYEEAIKAQHLALDLALEIQDSTGIAASYNNLGNILLRTWNLEDAFTYYQKSLHIAQKSKDQRGAAIAWGNLGATHKKLGRNSKALSAYAQSEQLTRKLKNPYQLSLLLNNIANLHQEQANWSQALHYYQEALSLSQKIEDKVGILINQYNLARLHLEQERYALAQRELEKVYQSAQKIQEKQVLMETANLLFVVHEALGNYEKAIRFARLFDHWRGILQNEKQLKKIMNLEATYQTQAKEKKISRLSQDIQLFLARINRQNLWIALLVLTILLLVFTTGLAFAVYRQKLQSRQQKANLYAVLEAQEQERQRMGSDLHDGLGGMLSTLQHRINQKTLNRAQITELLGTAISELRHISHNMMPAALTRYGLRYALEHLVRDLSSDGGLRAELHTFGLEKRLSTLQEVFVYRIIQELVQNVLKHAEAQHLRIHLTRHPKHLNLMVEDDGKGMDKASSDQVAGLGLTNIETRLRKLGGEMEIDSQPGLGTTISVDIPLRRKSTWLR